jgi:hypothetical protein
MRKLKKITVYFKGAFYGIDYFGYDTIKELLYNENIKRNNVDCFIKVE